MKLDVFQLAAMVLLLLSTTKGVWAEAPKQLPHSSKVKIAAVQISGYDKGDLPRPGYDVVAALVPHIQRAGKENAEMIVFPEYVLGHISVPGPETARISAAAAENHIYVVVGCWEVAEDKSYANSALIFDRRGKIIDRYRKTHAAVDHYEGEPAWSRPPAGKDRDWFLHNDPEWKMKRGQDLPVFEFDFGRVGILTCYDGWFPESFRALSLKGAELILWLNGRRGSVEDFIMKSVMFQSHVAMVSTNQAYGGGTMIGNVPAEILSSCPAGEEAYITAEVDLEKVRRIRKSSRNFQQRRPDLYGAVTREDLVSGDRAANNGKTEKSARQTKPTK